MTKFDQLRQRLNDDRSALDAARAEAYQARQSQKRTGAPKERVKTASDDALKALAAFADEADPRLNLGQLSDRSPILLFPLRLQTRFKQIENQGQIAHELWVRIYPDDCLIDSFEPTLSTSELEVLQRYWIEKWQAGRNESGERAAWRGLAAAVGSGRARWLIEQYAPLNPAAELSTGPEGLVLVIPTEQLITSNIEAEALSEYRIAIWRARDDSVATTTARGWLDTKVGASRADSLIADYQVANEKALPPVAGADRATVECKLAYQQLPPAAQIATKLRSWSAPAQARLLPERFLLLAYHGGAVEVDKLGNPIPSPLAVGPDPDAAPNDQLRHFAEGEVDELGHTHHAGELRMPEPMRWMADFDEAVRIGMGLRVGLTPEQASRGFEKLVVIGVRLADDAAQGQAGLQELLAHHRDSRPGLSLLPQGTPTNNLETEGSGHGRADDPDASFDAKLRQRADAGTSWYDRPDGRWLADALGIELSTFDGVAFANRLDVSEARAMNRLLWPATFGYMMSSMLAPAFSNADVSNLRWFYTHFISGRGALPVVRVGDQPYGILPATAVGRIAWLNSDRISAPSGLDVPRELRRGLARLTVILTVMRGEWSRLAEGSAHVGMDGDAHRILLDLLGLHPGSVEFHQRYAESLDQLFNHARFKGLGAALLAGIEARHLQQRAETLLRSLGYAGAPSPDILKHFFFGSANKLLGPLVDDRPLSEVDAVHASTNDGTNYLTWLRQTAGNSFERLRLEQGFTGDTPPNAMLYVLARHALMLGYYDTSLWLHESAGVIDGGQALQARREPSFIHVKETSASESHFTYLVSKDPRVSGNATVSVAERITAILKTVPETRWLDDQLAALDLLHALPTARLERSLTEHIDTASYRLDAWLLGLASFQLWAHRYHGIPQDPTPPAATPTHGPTTPAMRATANHGIYLGAYGYLEEVRPKASRLKPVVLEGELATEFASPPGGEPLMGDPANGGYVLAPSVPHATTAAVLRAGYLANATKANPGALAVNLTSSRVRVALDLLEGIRNGQSLGALLGYRFERGLHEGHSALELDVFIHALRKQFPLVADQMNSTQTAQGVPIEAIEARNVVDGLRMLEHIRSGDQRSYPFGLPLRQATGDESAAINAEVGKLFDIYDAMADLALAEGVHQAVLGNYDRVSSSLDAYAKATMPPEPEVVRTPRSGFGITHRVALHFEAGIAPTYVAHGLPKSPRAQAQPSVNKWLAGVLPPPAKVGCVVEWTDPLGGLVVRITVTQADLRLQPIDLLFLGSTFPEQAMSELEDRILRQALSTQTIRPDTRIAIRHTEHGDATLSFFALGALLSHLKDVLLGSRPLAPTDLAPAGAATQAGDGTRSIKEERITLVQADMSALLADLVAFDAWAQANAGTPDAARVEVDNVISRLAGLFERASSFALNQSGWGWSFQWRSRAFSDLLAIVRERRDAWKVRLVEADGLLNQFDSDPTMPVEEQMSLLSRVDRLLASAMIIPAPAPAAYRAQLATRRNLLVAKRDDFSGLLASPSPFLSNLLAAARVAPAVSLFDLTTYDLTNVDKEVNTFVADARARAKSLQGEIGRRLSAASAAVDAYKASTDTAKRVDALTVAGQALLGEDFKLVPGFTLSTKVATDVGQAWTDGLNGVLTKYLVNTRGVEFPVDDWLHGVARVRDKLRHWEQVSLLTQAITGSEPQLSPAQLPYRSNDDWLALEFPSNRKLEEEQLLYTAHFGGPTPANGQLCGLLLDEWTEVVPGTDATAGLAFNFDQPSSEPPQSWLLALPGRLDGQWHFDDLLDAVNDTFALARLRSVEPAQIDRTPYAQFLPATITAVTLYELAISANLARVNLFKTKLSGPANE